MRTTLRLLDKADKQIRELPRAVKGAIYDFQYKFKENPHSPGLRLKALQGDSRLLSARVNADYRALLLHVGAGDYILLGVHPRQHDYANLDRYRPRINRVTGAIEFVEVIPSTGTPEAGPSAGGAAAGAHAAPSEPDPTRPEPALPGQALPGPARPESALPEPALPEPALPESALPEPRAEAAPTPGVEPGAPPASEPAATNALLGGVTAEELLDLGVTEVLIPSIMATTTEEQLLKLAEYAPSHTEEVLLELAAGRSVGEVMEHVTRPVTATEEVDPDDFSAALNRVATRVTTEDTDLAEAIGDEFSRWKVFLHPTQARYVGRDYNGPARVSGGPGTGKTIVALHRVKHLVRQLPTGRSKRVLLTTFNKNLAADLHKRLLDLAGPDIAERVEVTHIDRLANQIVSESASGSRRRLISDTQALDEWRDLLVELGEERWDADFLYAEWSQVILGQGVRTRAEYFQARRAGRGRRISRAQRAEIWQLVERFTMRLDQHKTWTHRQIAAQAAAIKRNQAIAIAEHEAREARGGELIHRQDQSWASLRHDYDHIVVDEAQDLNAAHWVLLRNMVPEQRNDLFIVGDTHQRIYDNHVALSSLGVNIRGRSARLTLSYRTTRQILGNALRILGDEQWDDLDEGNDTLAGFRSVLRGAPPRLHGADSREEEFGFLAATVAQWKKDLAEEADQRGRAAESNTIAVAAPTRDIAAAAQKELSQHGIRAVQIGADGAPDVVDAVHIGTLHRFKGLEYRHVAVVCVSDGILPHHSLQEHLNTDPQRYQREYRRARSLLFVATTRARDSLLITWHGPPSPFLPEG